MDVAKVDRTSPYFPSPFGQIPALIDGDVEMFESGAILMYLADKYGGLDNPEKRAQAAKWVVWANSALDPICFKEDGNGRVLDTGLKGESKAIDKLDEILANQEFILGTEFSVADVAIGAYLLYVPQFFPSVNLMKWPNVRRYMLELCQRPAYAGAFGGLVTTQLSQLLMAMTKSRAKKRFGLF